MQTAAILQLALALLPFVTTGLPNFIAWLESLHTAVQQTAEWTPEQEADYRAKLFARTSDPAYAPDPA